MQPAWNHSKKEKSFAYDRQPPWVKQKREKFFVCVWELSLYFIYLFFIKFYWSMLLYNVVLASTAQQNEPAIHIQI